MFEIEYLTDKQGQPKAVIRFHGDRLFIRVYPRSSVDCFIQNLKCDRTFMVHMLRYDERSL